jgi:hypothetical protein
MPDEPYRTFDGYTLELHRADGSVVGAWPAISGAPGHQKPSEQGRRNTGPVPEGAAHFQRSKQRLGPWDQLIGSSGGQTPILNVQT